MSGSDHPLSELVAAVYASIGTPEVRQGADDLKAMLAPRQLIPTQHLALAAVHLASVLTAAPTHQERNAGVSVVLALALELAEGIAPIA